MSNLFPMLAPLRRFWIRFHSIVIDESSSEDRRCRWR